MKFGDRLRILREEKGMTQKELADALGIARGSISNYENNPDTGTVVKNLIAMAELFDVPIDYILGLTDCRERYSPATFEEINLDDVLQELPLEARKSIAEFTNVVRKKYLQK